MSKENIIIGGIMFVIKQMMVMLMIVVIVVTIVLDFLQVAIRKMRMMRITMTIIIMTVKKNKI